MYRPKPGDRALGVHAIVLAFLAYVNSLTHTYVNSLTHKASRRPTRLLAIATVRYLSKSI